MTANEEIVEIIEEAVKSNPSLRFNQILHGLCIVSSYRDTFYDNPESVLNRIRESELYKKMNERGSFKGIFE